MNMNRLKDKMAIRPFRCRFSLRKLCQQKIFIHECLFLIPNIKAITAPWILVGLFDQPASHWIQVDVSRKLQKI